jgi:hypothetical protein
MLNNLINLNQNNQNNTANKYSYNNSISKFDRPLLDQSGQGNLQKSNFNNNNE